MTRNISTLDKQIRVVLALILIVAGFVLQPTAGTLGLVLPIAVAVILLATVFMNFCPIYRLIGFSTFREKKAN